jgi:hypothetical protein
MEASSYSYLFPVFVVRFNIFIVKHESIDKCVNLKIYEKYYIENIFH